MTLSSRHRIQNLGPGTLPLGHGGSPQYWVSHVDGEKTVFVSFKLPRLGTEPRTLAWKAAVLTTTLGPPPFISPRFLNTHTSVRGCKCALWGLWTLTYLNDRLSAIIKSPLCRQRGGDILVCFCPFCVCLCMSASMGECSDWLEAQPEPATRSGISPRFLSCRHTRPPQQTRDVDSMLGSCWPTIYNA